jgi:hypothetical protein
MSITAISNASNGADEGEAVISYGVVFLEKHEFVLVLGLILASDLPSVSGRQPE